MAALATIDDLRAVMARPLGPDDNRRAPLLLDIASQRVRTFTGQHFELVTDDVVRLPARNSRVRLPQRPVVSVSTITDVSENALPFTWEGGSVVELSLTPLNVFELEPFRNRRNRYVVVTYTHGYSTVPADVVGIVCDMVAAAFDSPPENIGVQSETIGPFSASTSTQFAGGVRLTQTMRDALMNYMAPVGTAPIT